MSTFKAKLLTGAVLIVGCCVTQASATPPVGTPAIRKAVITQNAVHQAGPQAQSVVRPAIDNGSTKGSVINVHHHGWGHGYGGRYYGYYRGGGYYGGYRPYYAYRPYYGYSYPYYPVYPYGYYYPGSVGYQTWYRPGFSVYVGPGPGYYGGWYW